jgi:hypothetical protein
MLEERADHYYTLSFSSVHKHKVLLVMPLGIEEWKRTVGKQSSGSNGKDSEKR